MTILAETGREFEPTNDFVEPINLHKRGMLFAIKGRYWSCRAGNAPNRPDLTHDRIDAKAITSFGTKDLLDPEKTRKRFQEVEKKARHAQRVMQVPAVVAWLRDTTEDGRLADHTRVR